MDSYRMSMQLSREGLIAGPSSGEALHGLLRYIAQVKEAGQLEQLADETTGEISCVFTCSDLPYQYLPGYFERLGADEFPRIENEVRSGIAYVADLFRAIESGTNLRTRFCYSVTKPGTMRGGFSIPVTLQTSSLVWPM